MTSPRTRTITSARLKLNIVEWGDPSAPPLVLQHGGRDHARSWDPVAEAFAGDWRVIAPDLRGHGDSDWVSDGAYDLTDFVQDFVTIVDTLEPPPCAMIGHSLGGNIIARFGGLYPDRVTRMVNIEGLGFAPQHEAEAQGRDQIEVLRALVEARAKFSGYTPRRFPSLAALTARMMEIDARLTPEFAEHLARHASRENADGSVTVKHDPAIRDATPLDIRTDTKHRLWAAITCPVLLCYGLQSWASNPATDGRASHFRDARVELFDQAGHWPHHDRQADFIRIVREFLAA
jgi:pimeloyl-ACP methyl ester carboxylesterase